MSDGDETEKNQTGQSDVKCVGREASMIGKVSGEGGVPCHVS